MFLEQQTFSIEDMINYLHDKYHHADAIAVCSVIRTEYVPDQVTFQI